MIKKAWMLIKEAGCDKFKRRRCNQFLKNIVIFFVNNGNAKSSDIENLI